MVVIGFSIGHDRGAVLIRDGKVVVGINDEKTTNIDINFKNNKL